MFGPALLVSPVTQPGVTARDVYLPPAGFPYMRPWLPSTWYDFWTGKSVNGNQRIEAPAPIDRIPLYVKAGSILPMGPEIEYAGEKPDAPIALRIYRRDNVPFS